MATKYKLMCIASLIMVGLFIVVASESNEHESIVFIYSRNSHNFIIRVAQPDNHWICYVITLTDAERQQVHTDDGIKAIELKYFAMLVAARKVPASQINANDIRVCGHPKNGTVEYHLM